MWISFALVFLSKQLLSSTDSGILSAIKREKGGGVQFISRRLSLFIKDTSLLVRNSQHSSPLSWCHLIHRLKGPSGRPPGSELEGIM